MIPKQFRQFINTKLFKQLLAKIYEYMVLVHDHEQIYQREVVGAGLRHDLMTRETHQLQDKCKEISYVYMGILLSYGESKFIFKDQYFFETMVYFLSEILKEQFEEDHYPLLDQELNRIFRTDTFNLIKRRHQ